MISPAIAARDVVDDVHEARVFDTSPAFYEAEFIEDDETVFY
jgi:hypothetical protein